MTSPMEELLEGYAETAKDLVRKWADYASEVAGNLDSGYKANRASADWGKGVSLAIETGARLTWEALDAMATFTSAPNRPHVVESEFDARQYRGARLTLEGDLTNLPGNTLAARRVTVFPAQLGPKDKKFTIRADAAGCLAGVYRGNVLASTPAGTEKVKVWVKVP